MFAYICTELPLYGVLYMFRTKERGVQVLRMEYMEYTVWYTPYNRCIQWWSGIIAEHSFNFVCKISSIPHGMLYAHIRTTGYLRCTDNALAATLRWPTVIARAQLIFSRYNPYAQCVPLLYIHHNYQVKRAWMSKSANLYTAAFHETPIDLTKIVWKGEYGASWRHCTFERK